MNNHQIFFIAGVHGVGKDTLCKELSSILPADHLTASDLIKKRKKIEISKTVSKVLSNQEILLKEFSFYKPQFPYILLDGHSCLIDSNKKIVKLSTSLFKELKVNKIVLLKAEPEIIHNRLVSRDGNNSILTLNDISDLQQAEVEHSKFIANELEIKFIEFDVSKNTEKNQLQLLAKELQG
ncbi:ATP-binding protein [Acinetobacter pittii]|uniref:ATP-binding protein n=1 Tax=Acinetobacter pittii TaxID=48296 RepID=UPI003A8BC623